jgi:hypothetical protein
MNTLFLSPLTWDLALDAHRSIAMASNPYALAQNAASAIRTFIGECWYDTTIGVPYFGQILGAPLPIELMKAQFRAAALTVPDVVDARIFITGFAKRGVTGQVQVTDKTGTLTAASF